MWDQLHQLCTAAKEGNTQKYAALCLRLVDALLSWSTEKNILPLVDKSHYMVSGRDLQELLQNSSIDEVYIEQVFVAIESLTMEEESDNHQLLSNDVSISFKSLIKVFYLPTFLDNHRR